MGSVEEKVRYSYHADATMKRVFFIPLYDSHIQAFMPLVKRMEAQNVLEPLVIVLERVHTAKSARFLDEHNVPHMKVDLFPHSFKKGNRLNIRDLTMRKMEKHTVTLFHTRGKVKDLFNTLNPTLIITVNESYYADRFFLHEAKQRGIPSLSLYSVFPQGVSLPSPLKAGNTTTLHKIVHFLGQWFWSNVLSIYRDILTAFGIPLYYIGAPSKGQATKVCVWSELVKKELVKGGGFTEKIVVTGSPGHDAIYHKDSYFGQKTIDGLYRLLNIKKDKGIILFCSQPFAKDGICTFDNQKELTELIIETCAKFNDYVLVIKLHPREFVSDYAYIINGHRLQDKFRLVTDEDASLYELVYTSRLVIGQVSTTGIEAILFDKDIININLIIKTQPNYVREGTTINVYNETELPQALHQVLTDKETQMNLKKARERFIQNNFPEFDGKATDRVMELIFQLLKNG